MKIIATAILASTTALVGLTAAPATANYGTQVCVATPEALVHQAYAIETDADDDWLGGLIVRPLPNSAVGCQAYDGQPLQEWETLYPGTRTYFPKAACEPTEVIRTVEVQDPTLVGRVARQKAKIAHLRSVIRHLRNR